MAARRSRPVDKVSVGVHASRSDLKDGQTETTKRTRKLHLIDTDVVVVDDPNDPWAVPAPAVVTGSVDHETLTSEQVKRTAVEIAGVAVAPMIVCECGAPVARRGRNPPKFCKSCRALRSLARAKAYNKSQPDRRRQINAAYREANPEKRARAYRARKQRSNPRPSHVQCRICTAMVARGVGRRPIFCKPCAKDSQRQSVVRCRARKKAEREAAKAAEGQGK